MEIKEITREDEVRLPEFRSHQAAREFFEAKYGNAFELEDSFFVGEGAGATVCYRHSLVLDRATYERGLRELALGSMEDAGDFLESYQSFELMLDGSVHVIY